MCATITLRDIIRIAQHRFLVGIIPLHRYFDRDALLLTGGVKNIAVERGLVAVDEFDETLYTSGERKIFLFSRTLVDKFDFDAVVQKREFPQTAGQNIVVVLDSVKCLPTRQKINLCTAPLRLSDYSERRRGHTA